MIKDSAVGLFESGRIEANNIAWFFFALANVRILACLCSKKKLLFVIFIVVIILFKIKGINYFFLYQSVISLPFYFLGHYFKDSINNEASIRRGFVTRLFFSITLLLLSVLLSSINGHIDIWGLQFGGLPYGLNIFVFYINATIGTLLILNTSLLFSKYYMIVNKVSSAMMTIVGLQKIPLYLICVYLIGLNPKYIYSYWCPIKN